MKSSYQIDVSVETAINHVLTDTEQSRYAYSYTITITNNGSAPAKLLSRHWIISNADGNTEEVKGLGVVGQHPHLKPGESYQYTSGTVLQTEVGTMHGSYQMQADDGTLFEASIPVFSLTNTVLH